MSETAETKHDQSTSSQVATNRLAVILHKSLGGGAAANAAAIVAGGLRCEAFGEPIEGSDGVKHASIRWNMPILKAKTNGQLKKLLLAAASESVDAVAFCEEGRSLSNSFSDYESLVSSSATEDLTIVAVGLFGDDQAIRELTRAFSLFAG